MRSLSAVLLIATLLVARPVPAATDDIALATQGDVVSAIDRASTVTLSAYLLQTSNPVLAALVRAARRGAAVSVVLTGRGFGYATSQNRTDAVLLGAAGARVRLTDYPLHMKAAVINGNRVYVTDENFSTDGLVIQLPAGARMTVERAMLNQPSTYNNIFTTTKGTSLTLEASVIAAGVGGALAVESESFGASPVSEELQRALQARSAVTVVANRKDVEESDNARATLETLQRFGATVKLVEADEKLAITNGPCFAASANASNGLEDQIDWGLQIDDVAICRQLLARFKANAGL